MPNPKPYIINDQDTTEDKLDFAPYVETLVDVCKTASTPLTIGVFGTWGSGKTSLMRMIQKRLPKKYTVAWFDAWKYDKEETLWRALVIHVLNALYEHVLKTLQDAVPEKDKEAFDSLRNKEDLETALRKHLTGETKKELESSLEELRDMQTALYKPVDRENVGGITIDWGKLGFGMGKSALQIGLAFLPGGTVLTDLLREFREKGKSEEAIAKVVSAVHRERAQIHIEQIKFLEQFHDRFTFLTNKYVVKGKTRLIVIVDDLDRCLPEKAIEVLEAIKLFVDAPGCVFILGLDQDVIARGIEMKYKELGEKKDVEGKGQFMIEGMRYLEKIIQLPFQIPPIEQSDMGEFVEGLVADWPDDECSKVFTVGLVNNPRQIKRTVNVFLMLWKLAEKRKEKLEGRIKPIRLAKVVAIQAIYPELYDLLKEEPRYLSELEDFYRHDEVYTEVVTEDREPEAVAERVEPPPALKIFVSNPSVRRILTLHWPMELEDANFVGLKPDELRLYFTLTRRVETPQTSAAESLRQTFEPQMVQIPPGKFLMGSTLEQLSHAINTREKVWTNSEQPQREVVLSEYLIGKYPVTNREYQDFIRSTDNKPPRDWEGSQYPPEKGDHPVVNVSWKDATAYCEWLSKETSNNYHLPTEAEWEKSARGTDDRVWPWGDEFDSSKANTKEAKIGATTPVGQFSPQGDSVYGCSDMIGNVWEWCSDKWEFDSSNEISKSSHVSSQENNYIVRGGSFNRSSWDARCATRRANRSSLVGEAKGFRVALTVINKFDA